jgi:hypothetical protein
MYMVGQQMNMYFVNFSFRLWMVIVCNLSNTIEVNIVTNVIYDKKTSHWN